MHFYEIFHRKVFATIKHKFSKIFQRNILNDFFTKILVNFGKLERKVFGNFLLRDFGWFFRGGVTDRW